jgi:DNA-binding transcriptional ArsR family regulator
MGGRYREHMDNEDVTTPAEPQAGGIRGDVDIAAIGALLADPGRCRILMALNDGRSLPAGLLASEAGVSASTASSHLHKLTEAGLITVDRQGRNRFYRLAGPQVGQLLETITQLAPTQPVRSLRQGTRANALRTARTCYDHLAGRLGVGLMRTMLDRGYVFGGDGVADPGGQHPHDRRAGYGHDVDYQLTGDGHDFLVDFGVALPGRRRAVRYCVDWSERRHHLAGAMGRGLADRLVDLDWVRRDRSNRAVRITPEGEKGLADVFDLRIAG